MSNEHNVELVQCDETLYQLEQFLCLNTNKKLHVLFHICRCLHCPHCIFLSTILGLSNNSKGRTCQLMIPKTYGFVKTPVSEKNASLAESQGTGSDLCWNVSDVLNHCSKFQTRLRHRVDLNLPQTISTFSE